MKTLPNSIQIIITAFLMAFSLLSCGPSETDKNMEGNSLNKEQFLKDYESFVTEYCSVADQFKDASMQKKVTLGQKMAKESMTFMKYQKTIPAIGAQLTDDEQEKLDQLNEKVSKCAEKIKM